MCNPLYNCVINAVTQKRDNYVVASPIINAVALIFYKC